MAVFYVHPQNSLGNCSSGIEAGLRYFMSLRNKISNQGTAHVEGDSLVGAQMQKLELKIIALEKNIRSITKK